MTNRQTTDSRFDPLPEPPLSVPPGAIVRDLLFPTVFVACLTTSAVAFAQPASPFDAAQERARKDYQAAMVRIAAVSRADQMACAKQTGPAGKACTIQANGKRDAAEEEAKLALAYARVERPASKKEQEKAAADEKRQAKAAYGVAEARIANTRNLANVECKKLKKDEQSQCRKDVDARYMMARDSASSTYARALAKAHAMVER